MKLFSFYISLFSICFVFVANLSHAQVADVLIKTSNESPKEGETVKLRLESDKYNLNNAKVTWYVDGNEEDAGVGRKTFSVLMTNQNPVQVVSVSVTEEGLNDTQSQIILEISGDILLYEGYNSSAPLFYKGRSLPGKEGSANVQVLLFKDGEIKSFSPSSQNVNVFTWKINGEEKQEFSGQNRAQNILTARVVDNSLSLNILKQDENTGKNLSLNIPLQEPEINIYKESEDGLLKTLLGNSVTAKSINLFIEPFYFSVLNKYSPDLKYIWKINNLESNIATPWFVNFAGQNRETVKINLDISNIKKVIQNSPKAFTFTVE